MIHDILKVLRRLKWVIEVMRRLHRNNAPNRLLTIAYSYIDIGFHFRTISLLEASKDTPRGYGRYIFTTEPGGLKEVIKPAVELGRHKTSNQIENQIDIPSMVGQRTQVDA
jgi:hypothetical protein